MPSDLESTADAQSSAVGSAAIPHFKLILTLVFFEIETLAYLIVNRISSRLRSIDLMTPADAEVTLRERSLWLYLSFVPYCLMAVFEFNTLRRMFRIFVSVFINSLVAYRSFLRSPSSYPRPALPRLDPGTTLERSWQALHAVDRPSNTFPSIHVSHAFLLALILARHAPRERSDACVVWAMGIALSTLLTKQHYIVDISGGILVAEVIAKHVYEPWDDGRLRLGHAWRHIRDLCRQLDAMASAPAACRLPPTDRHPSIARVLAACREERSFARVYSSARGRADLFERKDLLLRFLGGMQRSLSVANTVMPGWLQFIRDFQAADPMLTDEQIHAYLEELDPHLNGTWDLVFDSPEPLAVLDVSTEPPASGADHEREQEEQEAWDVDPSGRVSTGIPPQLS